jgi:hypothetical protein
MKTITPRARRKTRERGDVEAFVYDSGVASKSEEARRPLRGRALADVELYATKGGEWCPDGEVGGVKKADRRSGAFLRG